MRELTDIELEAVSGGDLRAALDFVQDSNNAIAIKTVTELLGMGTPRPPA